MLPDASHYFVDLIFVLSCIAVVYTSLVALMQEDMKKLIAYSSVAHMGFVTLGIFAFNQQGIEGAIFQMISHGLVSGALFLCVGVVYDRLHTREISRYGGLVHTMPLYAAVFMVFMLGSVGLPATSGFVGEMMVLVGAFQASQWSALVASTGLVLGAAYMLWLYRRVCFGEMTKADLRDMTDISSREITIFVPLIVLVVALGVYPKPVLDRLHPSVEHLMKQVNAPSRAAKPVEAAAPAEAPAKPQAKKPAESKPAKPEAAKPAAVTKPAFSVGKPADEAPAVDAPTEATPVESEPDHNETPTEGEPQ